MRRSCGLQRIGNAARTVSSCAIAVIVGMRHCRHSCFCRRLFVGIGVVFVAVSCNSSGSSRSSRSNSSSNSCSNSGSSWRCCGCRGCCNACERLHVSSQAECVCICVFACVYACVCLCICTCLPVHMYVFACVHVCAIARFYNKYPCIIITAKGQPDVATRSR
jgi:hypothetical protein